MAYTYKGTKITGTSVSGKVFKNSGISKASKGDTYFNTSTGHVYKCVTGGKAKEAKWQYLRTDIAKKPTVAVSSLGAPVRVTGTHKMTATWKTPSAMVDTKKGDRATDLVVQWSIGIAGTDPKKIATTSNEKLTESTINLNNLTIGNKTYKRTDFYPLADKPKLNYVTIKVTSKNSKGEGASASNTREFALPRKPKISSFEFNGETGETSCTITTDAGEDYLERYDTQYKMTVYYSATDKTTTIHNDSTTATSKTIKFDDQGYASRDYEDFAKVTVQAWARGYKGKSDPVEKTYYVSYPAKPTIKKVVPSGSSSSDKCTVYIDTHNTTEHPVDRIKLEYLANSEYETAESIPGDAGWETSDIIDDGQCKALAITVADLIPERGNYTWLRLKSYHANETVLYRYSDYWRVTELETPAATALDDVIKIVSVVAGEDGKSAVVDLVWDDGELPSTGTELSWDSDENAWESTKEPNDYNFTWSNGPKTIDGTTWPDSATITIKDLSEGEKYYIKARRYNESDEITYSDYSNVVTLMTSETPESIGVVADRYVPKGSGLNVYWTFSGNSLQREWQIVDSNGTILVNGEGSIGATQIPAERLEAFAVNNDVVFTVQVSTGSGFVVSEEKIVTIIEEPEIEITDSSLIYDREEEILEYTGDVVSFTPKESAHISSVEVELEPHQDLHGYDSPWVGGAGKNKFDKDYLSDFSNYTNNVSGYYYTGKIQLKPNTNYIIKATDLTALSSDLYFVLYHVVGNDADDITITASSVIYPIYNGSVSLSAYQTFTTGETGVIRFGVANATALAEIMTKNYQLEEGSTATSYAPYANICPITGWTGCEVTDCGKNLFDEYFVFVTTFGGVKEADGSYYFANPNAIYTQTIWTNTKGYSGSLALTLIRKTTANKNSIRFNVYYTDGTSQKIGNTNGTGGFDTYTLVTNSSKTVDRIVGDYGSNEPNYINFQIELSPTTTTYEQYTGTTYPVSWQTEAGTVYGGTVDVVSGVLTVTHTIRLYDGSEDEGWTKSSSYDRFYANNYNMPEVNSYNGKANWLKAVNDFDLFGIRIGYGNRIIYLCNLIANIPSITDLASFKTFLSNNPLQVWYPLATPQTYQLDPVQVQTLIGQNNVWANNGTLKVKTTELLFEGDELKTNDLSITLESNKLCDVKLIVTSQGATGQFPQGILRQTEGDTIHSDLYSPVWTEITGGFRSTINLPTGLDFWDKSSYTLSVVGIDRQTNLQSEKDELFIFVSWLHQAPSIEPAEVYTLSEDTTVLDNKNYYSYDSTTEVYTVIETEGTENPSSEGWYEVSVTNYVTLTPIDEVDDNGFHHQAVRINLTPPPNSISTDVYDIYRMTGDGVQLIGRDFPLTYEATDEYAPFGDDLTNHYRIAIRTEDGDVEFSDIEYLLDGDMIRLDWAEGFIEYPYSIDIGDSYSKDVDIRKHLDGSIGAYWNQGIERKGSLSTDVIKILQQNDIDLTRRLARYIGPVFVRTREGTAFEADVQISNLNTKNIAVMSIAIDATEVDLTDEFMLPTPFELVEE